MDLPTALSDISWGTILGVLAGLYAVSVAVFLVLENRSPQSTFAWLFLFLIVPIGGLIIYVLFGREWKAFSRRHALRSLIDDTALAERGRTLVEQQPALLEALSAAGSGPSGRLGHMLWASARAPLTLDNRLEILQNASASAGRTCTPCVRLGTKPAGPGACPRCVGISPSFDRWRRYDRAPFRP